MSANTSEALLSHFSDCALHNEPAEQNGQCSCGVEERNRIIRGIRLDARLGIVPSLYWDIAQRLHDAYVEEHAQSAELASLRNESAALRARCDAAEKLLMECSDHGRFYYSTRTKSNGRYCDFVDRLKAFTAERAKDFTK